MGIGLRRVAIHGHEVAYRMAGQGPVVLLVHGLAGSSRTWRAVMPALAERYTVIAPDLLGCGRSAKPRGDYSLGAHAAGLRDLLIALDLGPATVVGQSLGGGVAMQFAYQHPEYCERLVLVASGGLGREVSWMLRALALPGAEYVAPVIFPRVVRDAGQTVLGWLGARGIRAPHLEEMWRAYASLVDADCRAAFIRMLRAVVDPGGQAVCARDRLYLAAAMPTLIVWGDRDPIIPVQHAHDAHAAMPGSRLAIFPGTGHFPHLERPQRFVDLLTDFLETTAPARDLALRTLLLARSAG